MFVDWRWQSIRKTYDNHDELKGDAEGRHGLFVGWGGDRDVVKLRKSATITCQGSEQPPLEGRDQLRPEDNAVKDAQKRCGLGDQVVEVEAVAKNMYRCDRMRDACKYS